MAHLPKVLALSFFNLLSVLQVLGNEEEFCRLKLNKNMVCPDSPSYTPWPHDEECRNYRVRLHPEHTWTPRALAVFPCRGQSRLDQMIEWSTGAYVGSLMPHFSRIDTDTTQTPQKFDSYMEGNEGKCMPQSPSWSGRTIVQETFHAFNDIYPKWYTRKLGVRGNDISLSDLSTMMFDYRGILLIRNPWDSLPEWRGNLRSNTRFCCARGGGIRAGKDFDFTGTAFENFFIKTAKMWVSSVKTWITEAKTPSDLLVVRYEKFLENTEPELRRILNYLNVPVDEGRMKCIGKYPPPFRANHTLTPEVQKTVRGLVLRNEVANQILIEGIKEINVAFRERGVEEQLDYAPPSI